MRFNQCGFRKGFNTQHIYVAMIVKMKTGGNKQFLSWACDETGQHNGKKKKCFTEIWFSIASICCLNT